MDDEDGRVEEAKEEGNGVVDPDKLEYEKMPTALVRELEEVG